MERQSCLETIRLLSEENKALVEEIERIRKDKKYVEALARKRLNLIKENEVVYRFSTEEPSNDLIIPITSSTQQLDEGGEIQREVGGNG